MAVMVPAVLMLALFAAPATVEAHGWLEDPPARQYCNPPDYSLTFSAGNGAHGMNYLPGDVKNTAGGVPGLCGDPFQGKADSAASNYAGKPCPPTKVYKAGGTFTTEVHVIANHGGWWEMSICDSTGISQACFDKNVLKSVETGSERWYILTSTIESPNTRQPEKYSMTWQLPPGLTCEHCVVQWSWWTAHRCTFPCDKAVCGFYADGLNKIALPHKTHPLEQCASLSPGPGEDPQMFRNCADIKITTDGTGETAGPVNMEDDSYEPTDDLETLDMGDDDDSAEMPADMPAESPAGDNSTGASTTVFTSVTTDGGGTQTDTDDASSGGNDISGDEDSNGGALKSREKRPTQALMVEEKDGEPQQRYDGVPGVPQWSTRPERRAKNRLRKPRKVRKV